MKYSVERIEESIALCEDDDGNRATFNLENLPKNIREGDIFSVTENGIVLLNDETACRRKKMAEMQKNLFGKRRQ